VAENIYDPSERVLTVNRFFLLLALLGFISCAKNTHHGSSQNEQVRHYQLSDSADNEWVNPILVHRLTTREEPFRSFPFDVNQSDSERIDSTGFNGFIQRVNSSFAVSNLSIAEADMIYSIIQKSGLLRTDPGAINPRLKATSSNLLSLDKLRSRVAFKRVGDDWRFGVFYKMHDCGWNYSHEEIEVNPGDSIINTVEIVETWVARTPC